ncbi:MAG: hypothetical protein CMF22_10310 [Idiomarinaceae bacterium]|nr:hypothetical protein [Idiomarinaceae bacterium]MBG23833.1 hypothetical protein [Idiomarinaceae bacterium]|tara:strand:+ start:28190 stop:28924 length:735 start_codon:yes stop_codon:yes gene_type:complete
MKTLNIRFVRKSSNKKTGPIPVTTTSANSCSITCPLNKDDNGETLTTQGKLPKCYAGFGNTAIHWRKLNDENATGKNITDWAGLCDNVKSLPKGQLWRHNEAGDMPTLEDNITLDSVALDNLIRANKGKKGFTYTHHALTHANIPAIGNSNSRGFTINVSANNTIEAVDIVKRYALPTVTLLPIDAPNVQHVEGVKVVACPAEKSDKVTCSNCGICADSKRDYVIGFRAHGTAKKKADIIAKAG